MIFRLSDEPVYLRLITYTMSPEPTTTFLLRGLGLIWVVGAKRKFKE
jgi:hypothetical protein